MLAFWLRTGMYVLPSLPSFLSPSRFLPLSSLSYTNIKNQWMPAQKENLLLLTIHLPPSSTTTRTPLILKTMTEAGILAKIGLNSLGVGVCLNAIRAKGLDKSRIPCHLGLRMVLESASREEAVRRLKEEGVASACHMLVADATGGVGLEW